MAEAKASIDIEASVEDLWQLVADFGEIGWMRGVKKVEVSGEGVGMTRAVYAGDGDPIIEELEHLDADGRRLGYTIARNNPMPVDDYHAYCLAIDLGGGRSRLEWGCTFEPKGIDEASAKTTVEGMYGMLTGWVKSALEEG